MPFSRQIRSNSTSIGWCRESASEDATVIGEDFVGHAIAAQRGGEMPTHGPRHSPGHDTGAHHEPRVIVDGGEHLALGPIGQQHPTDDIQLPQLHGPAPFPPLEIPQPFATLVRNDEPVTDQSPIDPHTRRHLIHTVAGEAIRDPRRTPIGMLTA